MVSYKRKWFCFLIATLGMVLPTATTSAQSAHEDVRKEYEKTVTAWKNNYKEMLSVYKQFVVCEEDEAEELQNRYRSLKAQGDQLATKTINLAADVYEASESPDLELAELLAELPNRYYVSSRYARSARIGKALLKHEPRNQSVMFHTTRSAFFSNNFDLANELLNNWRVMFGNLPPELLAVEEYLVTIQQEWERELKLREQDAADPDLPRLEFVTNKGNIVVELFEHQSPLIVNNFMALVETTPVLKELVFYSVIQHQFAITGCTKGDGSAVLRIGTITEEDQDNARGHFRGAFSLEINPSDGAVLTACRFVRIPIPEFGTVREGQKLPPNLVIGRVIEGMEFVDQLEATHKMDERLEFQPIPEVTQDRLIDVRVVRKPEGKIYKHIEPEKEN